MAFQNPITSIGDGSDLSLRSKRVLLIGVQKIFDNLADQIILSWLMCINVEFFISS